MTEYIERGALDRALTIAAANGKDKDRRTWAKAICVLHDMPVVDVAPVVHGKWLDAGRGIKACSNCNHGIKEHMACVNHYCPNCGAKMNGGASNAPD